MTQNPSPAYAPQGQPPAVVQVTPGAPAPSPSEVYEALRYQRRELQNQRERVLDERRQTSDELQQRQNMSTAEKNGLEGRLTFLDARLAALDKQMAESDAAVAQAAAVPGAIVPDFPTPRQGPPEEVFVLAGIFMFVVLLPMSIAYSRRIWRRGARIVSAIPQEVHDRFTRIEQSLDAIAVEVERVGEGQRFLTRLQAQPQERAIGAGPAPVVEVPVREAEGLPRR